MDPKDNIQRLMNEKNVQFRDFRLTNIEQREAAENAGGSLILDGVACSFGVETVLFKEPKSECREKIASTAFDGCDMSDVIFNFNHCGRVYARTRNNSLTLTVQPDGLHMHAVLLPDDNGHAELYRDIKSGLIDKMSFAFSVSECSYEYIEAADKPTIAIRTITKIDKLYDVSAVDIPAYDTTSISARRAFDAEREKRLAESKKRADMLELAKAKYFYKGR